MSSKTAKTDYKPTDWLCHLQDIASHKQEHFVVLTLDQNQKLIKKRIVFIGTLTAVIAHPREIFALALEDRAVSIIVAHNHLSGDPAPSQADTSMTKQLVSAGLILGVWLEVHIIVTGSKHFSYTESGALTNQ